MRIRAFPLIASVMLFAAPAFAQTSGATSTQPNAAAPSSNLPPDTQVTLNTQENLKRSLMQNGFKDVMVAPEAYIIHAQAPDGSHIVMVVSPDQVRGIIVNTGSSSGPNGSMQNAPSAPSEGGGNH